MQIIKTCALAFVLCSCASHKNAKGLQPSFSNWSIAALFTYTKWQAWSGSPSLSMQVADAKPLFSMALQKRITELHIIESKINNNRNTDYNNYILIHSDCYFRRGCIVSPSAYPDFGFNYLSRSRLVNSNRTYLDSWRFKLHTITGRTALMDISVFWEGGRQVIGEIKTTDDSGREILFSETLSTLIHDLKAIAAKAS